MTTTDWYATGAMLQGIGNVLGAVTVALAAWLGNRTYESWRQQKLSERHIDQAERILTATYKARRSLKNVRNPAMFNHELEKAEETLRANGEWSKVLNESDQRRLAYAQAYYHRLELTNDDRQALEECQPMARALFGGLLEAALEKLNHQFWTVKVYVDANYRDDDGTDREFRQKIERAIWTGYPASEKNEIDQLVASQVLIIEQTCLPILRLEEDSISRKKQKGLAT